MGNKPVWQVVRSWATVHPWQWAATVALMIILIGLVGELLEEGPTNWPRTIGVGLVLGGVLGFQAKARS